MDTVTEWSRWVGIPSVSFSAFYASISPCYHIISLSLRVTTMPSLSLSRSLPLGGSRPVCEVAQVLAGLGRGLARLPERGAPGGAGTGHRTHHRARLSRPDLWFSLCASYIAMVLPCPRTCYLFRHPVAPKHH